MGRLYRIPAGQAPVEDDRVETQVVSPQGQTATGQDSDRSSGVLGEFVRTGFRGRHNLKLLRRALEKDWGMPPAGKRLVVAEMLKIVAQNPDPRFKIGAARTCVAIDALDLKREHGPKRPDQHLHLHGDGPDKPATLAEFRAQMLARRQAAQQSQPADGTVIVSTAVQITD